MRMHAGRLENGTKAHRMLLYLLENLGVWLGTDELARAIRTTNPSTVVSEVRNRLSADPNARYSIERSSRGRSRNFYRLVPRT